MDQSTGDMRALYSLVLFGFLCWMHRGLAYKDLKHPATEDMDYSIGPIGPPPNYYQTSADDDWKPALAPAFGPTPTSEQPPFKEPSLRPLETPVHVKYPQLNRCNWQRFRPRSLGQPGRASIFDL